MSIRLSFNPRLNESAQQLCEEYWAFNNNDDYVIYVVELCRKYQLTAHELFRVIEKCYVCLDDVSCNHCGCYCPIEVPADIPYMRSKDYWFCEECVRFSRGQVLIGK